MKNQIISISSFGGIKSSLTIFFQLITWENIWKLISVISLVIGIICGLWIILSITGFVIIASWAAFGTTSFSNDNTLTIIAINFWHLTTFGKIMALALVVNSINKINHFFKNEEAVEEALDKISNFFSKIKK